MSNEFARIAKYFAPLASTPGAYQLTDDAAVIAPTAGRELVFTKDAITEGIHFTGKESPDFLAKKLLRVNLSDLAAMGATPLYYMLAVILPKTIDDAWLAAFTEGLKQDQEKFGITLIGGDSSSTAGEHISLSLTAIGQVPAGKALRRSGAKVGDVVCVSGTIGDGALGLASVSGKLTGMNTVHKAYLEQRYYLPQPRLQLGEALLGKAHACIDISDGLVADAGHIAATSGVKLEIDASSVPLSKAARACVDATPQWWEAVLTGGDDYELLFTLPESQAAGLADDAPVTIIGKVVEGSGVSVKDVPVNEMTFERAGWVHG